MLHLRIASVALGSAIAAFGWSLDYSTPGERLGSAIPAIGAKSGLNLTVDPAWTEEVVVIRAKDVDAFDLLTQIANATGLSWIQSQGGYRLSQTSQNQATARQTFYEQSFAMIQAYEPGSGRREVLASIIVDFPAQTLANLAVGTRTVFSTQPNRNQVQLPSSVRQTALNHVNQQRSDLAARMTQGLNQNNPNPRALEMINRLRQPVRKVNLVVQRRQFNQLIFSLQAIDQQGEQSLNQNQSVTYQPVGTAPLALDGFNLPEGEIRDRLRAFGGRADSYGKFAEEFRAAILDPVKHEPVALALGPALIESAPAEVNFVAVLPDERLTDLSRNLATSGFTAFSAPDALLESTREGSWIVVKPRLHLVDWAKRRNRAAFAKLAQAYVQDRVLNLDAMAEYARYASDDFSTNGWDFVLGRELLGSAFESELRQFFGSNLEGLHIYSALKSRLTSERNQTHPIGSLNSSFLNWMIFNSSQSPERQVRQQNRRVTERGERTEMLAAGLPANGQIVVTRNVESVVIGRSTDGLQRHVLSERDLASMRASQLNGTIRSPAAQLANTSSEFGLTQRVRFTFTIAYEDGTTLTRSVSGTMPARSYGSYDSLPADMRQRAEQQATQMLQRANRGGGGNRGATGQRRGGGRPPQP